MRRRLHVIVLAGLCATQVSLHVPGGPVPAPANSATTAALQPIAPAVARVREHLDRYTTGLTRGELDTLAGTIVQEARHQEISVDLVLAVMHVESRFHAFAVSPVGALGLMQILPGTGRELAEKRDIPWMGARTLFDPQVNVKLGVAYLKWLERRYGRIDVALAAYNWGPGRIDRKLRSGRPVPAKYAQDVLAVYRSRRAS